MPTDRKKQYDAAYAAEHATQVKRQTMEKKVDRRTKYDAANTIHIGIKLNLKTDADILATLNGKAKQTEIKRMSRLDLATENQ